MEGFPAAHERLRLALTIGAVDLQVTVLWWLGLVAVATWVLLRTRAGNWIFAVGGNKEAARAVGVPVARTKVGLYMARRLLRLDLRTAPAVLLRRRPVRRGRRQRAPVHHRGRHRRLPADRRLRLGDRRRGRRVHLRHDQQGHRVRRSGTRTGSSSSSGRCCCSPPCSTLGPQAGGGRPHDRRRPTTAPAPGTAGGAAGRADGVSKSYGNVRALRGRLPGGARRARSPASWATTARASPPSSRSSPGCTRTTRAASPSRARRSRLGSPREALDRGIATVYQDLAVVPLMPVWRNFFLGSEPSKGRGPLRRLDVAAMRATTHARAAAHGHRPARRRPAHRHPLRRRAAVRGHRPRRPLRRQGAGPGRADRRAGRQAVGVVLKYVAAARDAGLGVVLITHNPHHAYLVGDRFVLLKRGAMAGSHLKRRDRRWTS